VGKKFRILRIVAVIWKVLAWIVLVLSVLGGCANIVIGLTLGAGARNTGSALGLPAFGVLGGVVVALVAIFFGILYFIFLYAFAELVDVMLALEENTRSTAEQLKNIAKA
jgi:hypothetical protein